MFSKPHFIVAKKSGTKLALNFMTLKYFKSQRKLLLFADIILANARLNFAYVCAYICVCIHAGLALGPAETNAKLFVEPHTPAWRPYSPEQTAAVSPGPMARCTKHSTQKYVAVTMSLPSASRGVGLDLEPIEPRAGRRAVQQQHSSCCTFLTNGRFHTRRSATARGIDCGSGHSPCSLRTWPLQVQGQTGQIALMPATGGQAGQVLCKHLLGPHSISFASLMQHHWKWFLRFRQVPQSPGLVRISWSTCWLKMPYLFYKTMQGQPGGHPTYLHNLMKGGHKIPKKLQPPSGSAQWFPQEVTFSPAVDPTYYRPTTSAIK